MSIVVEELQVLVEAVETDLDRGLASAERKINAWAEQEFKDAKLDANIDAVLAKLAAVRAEWEAIQRDMAGGLSVGGAGGLGHTFTRGAGPKAAPVTALTTSPTSSTPGVARTTNPQRIAATTAAAVEQIAKTTEVRVEAMAQTTAQKLATIQAESAARLTAREAETQAKVAGIRLTGEEKTAQRVAQVRAVADEKESQREERAASRAAANAAKRVEAENVAASKAAGRRAARARDQLGDKFSAGATIAGGATLFGLAVATKEGIAFEDSFANVRKTVEGTNAQLDAMALGIRHLSTEIPVAAEQLDDIAANAGQLGVKRESVLSFTRTVADLSVATKLTAEQASTDMAKLANITEMPQESFNRLGSVIARLGNIGASTESEILDMAKRIAGAGHTVGMSQAQILGVANALTSLGIEAEMGGSAFSRTLLKITSDSAKGSKELKVFAAVAGESTAEFKKQFDHNATEAVTRFIEGLGKLPKSQIIGVLEAVGLKSIRLEDTLLRASGAGKLLRTSLDEAGAAWEKGDVHTRMAAERYQTTANRIKIAQNNLADMAREMSKTTIPLTVALAGDLEKAAKGFNSQSDAAKDAQVRFLAYGAAGLIVLGQVKKVLEVLKLLKEAHLVAGLAAGTQATAEEVAAARTATAWTAAGAKIEASGVLSKLGLIGSALGKAGGIAGAGLLLGEAGQDALASTKWGKEHGIPTADEARRNMSTRWDMRGDHWERIPTEGERGVWNDPRTYDYLGGDSGPRALAARLLREQHAGGGANGEANGDEGKTFNQAVADATKEAGKHKKTAEERAAEKAEREADTLADHARQRQAQALAKEAQQWNALQGVIDGVRGKTSELDTTTEAARLSARLLRDEFAAIPQPIKDAAVELAGLAEKFEQLTKQRNTVRESNNETLRGLLRSGADPSGFLSAVKAQEAAYNFGPRLAEARAQLTAKGANLSALAGGRERALQTGADALRQENFYTRPGTAPSYVAGMLRDSGKVIGLQCGEAITKYLRESGIKGTATSLTNRANVSPDAQGHLPPGAVVHARRGSDAYPKGHYMMVGPDGAHWVESNYDVSKGVTSNRPINWERDLGAATWGGKLHAYMPPAPTAPTQRAGTSAPAAPGTPAPWQGVPYGPPTQAQVRSMDGQNSLVNALQTMLKGWGPLVNDSGMKPGEVREHRLARQDRIFGELAEDAAAGRAPRYTEAQLKAERAAANAADYAAQTKQAADELKKAIAEDAKAMRDAVIAEKEGTVAGKQLTAADEARFAPTFDARGLRSGILGSRGGAEDTMAGFSAFLPPEAYYNADDRDVPDVDPRIALAARARANAAMARLMGGLMQSAPGMADRLGATLEGAGPLARQHIHDLPDRDFEQGETRRRRLLNKQLDTIGSYGADDPELQIQLALLQKQHELIEQNSHAASEDLKVNVDGRLKAYEEEIRAEQQISQLSESRQNAARAVEASLMMQKDYELIGARTAAERLAIEEKYFDLLNQKRNIEVSPEEKAAREQQARQAQINEAAARALGLKEQLRDSLVHGIEEGTQRGGNILQNWLAEMGQMIEHAALSRIISKIFGVPGEGFDILDLLAGKGRRPKLASDPGMGGGGGLLDKASYALSGQIKAERRPLLPDMPDAVRNPLLPKAPASHAKGIASAIGDALGIGGTGAGGSIRAAHVTIHSDNTTLHGGMMSGGAVGGSAGSKPSGEQFLSGLLGQVI